MLQLFIHQSERLDLIFTRGVNVAIFYGRRWFRARTFGFSQVCPQLIITSAARP
jgi:hypothetical protein